jgi:hypothetical protein
MLKSSLFISIWFSVFNKSGVESQLEFGGNLLFSAVKLALIVVHSKRFYIAFKLRFLLVESERIKASGAFETRGKVRHNSALEKTACAVGHNIIADWP